MNLIVADADQIRAILSPIVSEAVAAAFDTRPQPPDNTDQQPDLLSREQACRFLGITAPTVRRLVIRGDLSSVRIGRRVLFRRGDLEAFAAGGGAV